METHGYVRMKEVHHRVTISSFCAWLSPLAPISFVRAGFMSPCRDTKKICYISQ